MIARALARLQPHAARIFLENLAPYRAGEPLRNEVA